ncbi:MAG: ferrochelatase, partial [Nitrospira sp.]|nr:ferrochelatase [Nitrospira sp.]
MGVLLMSYGSPESLDDFEAYFTDIRGGRKPSPELVEEIKNRYRLIGGTSPLVQITQAQAKALEKRLNTQPTNQSGLSHRSYRVYVGMRHWHPYIKEAFKKILEGDVKHLVAMALAPQYSRMSVGAYIQKVKEAKTQLNSP